MRIVLKILLMIPVMYLAVMPVLMALRVSSQPCGGVEINIRDSSEYHFVTKKQLLNIVYSKGGRLAGKPLKEISVEEIESGIRELHELRQAEVYTSVDGTIHVYADQRNPVMRLMPDGGGDYFVDEEGVVIRKRNLYNPRLHIVGGNVTVSSAMLNGMSVFDTSIKRTILRDIYALVEYIDDDSFWAAQIDQIWVDKDDEIDLIPRVGSHIIHLGTIDDLEIKLRSLAVFYEKVLPEVGWNKYSVINLEYKDEIVCKRR
jgi:cell division protein FtsQ